MWYENGNDPMDTVIGCEITAIRNLASAPFTWRLDDASKRQIAVMVRDAMAGYKSDKFYFSPLSVLSARQCAALAERRVITPEFVSERDSGMLIMSEDEHISIMICGENHLRIRVAQPGRDVHRALEEFKRLERYLDSKLHFAFDSRLGFLCPDPTFLGTGMNISLLMWLPGLSKNGGINQIASSADKLGFGVSAVFGAQLNQVGDVYAVSNHITMGISEEKAAENLSLFAEQLTTSERNACESFAGDVNIAETVRRSAQIAAGAAMLSANEMLEAFSWISLGISMGIIKMSRRVLDSLIFPMQPASLNVANRETLDVHARDMMRAAVIKKTLAAAGDDF